MKTAEIHIKIKYEDRRGSLLMDSYNGGRRMRRDSKEWRMHISDINTLDYMFLFEKIYDIAEK